MITIEKKSLAGYSFIDLFAGLGGFRIALESLGAKCVYSNEWNVPVQKVYADNFGDIPEGDITQVDENTIPDHDILCARIVKAKKPKVVFMENVKNFATHDHGKTLEVVKRTMETLGYTFYQKVLNAVDYGIPQKRERIYMVCFRNDLGITGFSYPKPFKLTRHVENFLLDDEEMVKDLYVERPDTYFNGIEDDQYSNKSIRLGIVNKGGQGERIYSTKGIAITLSASGGGVFAKTGGYLINGKTRKLHPRECARIMGYPDTYKISDSKSQAYKQFGNSVVIDVLQLIGEEIGAVLERSVLERSGL